MQAGAVVFSCSAEGAAVDARVSDLHLLVLCCLEIQGESMSVKHVSS